MDIRLLHEQQEKIMNETVGIINPSAHDFTCTHDTNEDRKPVTYTIKSREGLMLKRYIADHVSEKLCTEILAHEKSPVTEEMKKETLKSIRLYDYDE